MNGILERRAHPRVSLTRPVELKLKQSNTSIKGKTVDLSEDGMCIEVEQPLLAHSLTQSIVLLNGSNRIKTNLQILWSRSKEETNSILYGGRFVNLEESSVNFLKETIEGRNKLILASYMPAKKLTNEEIIASGLNSTPVVLERSLGAVERRVAGPDETAAEMMAKVARKILEQTDCPVSQIDRIICATDVGDAVEPETAVSVQANIGATCPSFGISMSCAGWLAGVDVALRYLRNGKKRILVLGSSLVGSKTYFRNLQNRAIFGDGAGGILLEPQHLDKFLSIDLWSNGKYYSKIFIPHPWTKLPDDIPPEYKGSFYMDPNQNTFFKAMEEFLVPFCKHILNQARVSLEDIDVFLMHYASKPLFEHSLRLLKIPREKTFHRFDKYGNIAAAEMPVFLDEAIREGVIRKGNLVFIVTYGAGFTMAGTVIRY